MKKVWQKLGWVKRTFSTRSMSSLKNTWNSLIQLHIDYGSVLVCPFSKGEKKKCDKPLRTFIKLAPNCKEMNYWERLSHYKLYSFEIRMEYYRVSYIWKSLIGLVPSLRLEWLNTGSRNGWHLKYPKIVGPKGRMRMLHRNLIHWEGIIQFSPILF